MAFQVGSAVADITPRSPCHLAGYGARDHAHEGVHDPLSVRGFYVRTDQGEALVFSADILWYSEQMIARIASALEGKMNIPPLHVQFCGTHTHSAPDVKNEANGEWIQLVEAQTVAAAALAKTRAQNAGLFCGHGESRIGVNRRELLPDGSITLGLNPDGPNDREVIVLEARGAGDQVLGRMGNFACHGTALSQRNYMLSGDWPGLAATRLEADTPGEWLFLNGGAANICPRVDRQEAFEPIQEMADEFADDMHGICRSLSALAEDDAIMGAESVLQLPRKQRDIDEGMGKFRQVRIQGLRIGALRILAFPGEVFSQTTIAVKKAFPGQTVMVCSYMSGCSAGYVPVAEAYETGGYEVRVSPYAETAEAVLRQGFIDLVHALDSPADASG